MTTIATGVRAGQLAYQNLDTPVQAQALPARSYEEWLADGRHHLYGVFSGVGRYADFAARCARVFAEHYAHLLNHDNIGASKLEALIKTVNASICDESLRLWPGYAEELPCAAGLIHLTRRRRQILANGCHFGDVRVHHVRASKITSLTADWDHALAKVKDARKTQDDLEQYDFASRMPAGLQQIWQAYKRERAPYRVLGQQRPTVEIWTHAVAPGDWIIISSRGVRTIPALSLARTIRQTEHVDQALGLITCIWKNSQGNEDLRVVCADATIVAVHIL